jgi:hypothetical protein
LKNGITKYNVFSVVIGVAIVIQFIRPDFTNPKVDETVTLNTDSKVVKVLKTSCYDCHSSETKYPWYSKIAPASWIISDHIRRGRSALDFSNWENIVPNVKLERLKRAKHLIMNDLMPKHDYLFMHKDAVLNDTDRKTLEDFFDSQIQTLQSKEYNTVLDPMLFSPNH